MSNELRVFLPGGNDVSSSYKMVQDNEQFIVRNSFEVEAGCLDQLFGENSDIDAINIIKLDVQGAELDVLSGGGQFLKKTKLLTVEQSIRSPYSGGSKYYEVDEFLRMHGFEILDLITTYRKRGMILNEFDAIYINRNLNLKLI